jgi:hypothetical protein
MDIRLDFAINCQIIFGKSKFVLFFVELSYTRALEGVLSNKIFIKHYSSYASMNKLALAVVVTGVMVAVALAPVLLSSALAVKEQTCTNRGGHEKECGTSSAKVERCTAGFGAAEPRSCAGAR